MDQSKISVIITTYNAPRFLFKVLESLIHQTDKNFEVIVADDGSSEDTQMLVEHYIVRNHYPMKHAWHEDKGFRAAAARNNAVRVSSGSYLVFLDGDCIVLPDFIEKHRRCAEPSYMVRGSRVMLKENYTNTVLVKGIQLPSSFIGWCVRRAKGDVKRIFPLSRLPYPQYSRAHSWYGVKTCNLGIWATDFNTVNGFDEFYEGWGHEDADLAVRLMRYGVARKEGGSEVPVIHLWHKENDRSRTSLNVDRLKNVINSDDVVAQRGLKQK